MSRQASTGRSSSGSFNANKVKARKSDLEKTRQEFDEASDGETPVVEVEEAEESESEPTSPPPKKVKKTKGSKGSAVATDQYEGDFLDFSMTSPRMHERKRRKQVVGLGYNFEMCEGDPNSAYQSRTITLKKKYKGENNQDKFINLHIKYESVPALALGALHFCEANPEIANIIKADPDFMDKLKDMVKKMSEMY